VVMGLDNPIHIVFIVVILLLVFGAKRLPEIGRSLGGGMREFKDSVSGNPAPTQQQQTLTPAAQQPQAPVAQPAPAQPPVAAPPTPVQAAAPPVAAPPTPTQVAPAPAAAPVEPQPEPQHQA
jgi:sec-independent protein translocase protein TatA